MTKIYLSALITLTLSLSSCSKDFLKRYEERIIGTWYIADINRLGIGGSVDELPFREGVFEFFENGTLSYDNGSGTRFTGTWEIQRITRANESTRSFHITAYDFANERVLAEFYSEMNFRSTNHFVGKTRSGVQTFVTHFRR